MSEKSILIVEDNATNRKLILVVLRSLGFQLLTAQDGEEAIAIATHSLPDLILMDLQLPRLSGFSAAEILKNQPGTAHIPILALTASTTQAEREKAKMVGINGYIIKPINTRTFPALIQTFLERGVLE